MRQRVDPQRPAADGRVGGGLMPHLWLALTPHGWGHAGQVAPVVNALAQRRGDLRVTVQSPLPREVLASMLAVPFDHEPRPSDVGMVMRSALEIDLEASHAAYAQLHDGFDEKVDSLAVLLRERRADAVLAGVPYLPLAAARRAGLPAAALSSLNWADIYQHYFGADGVHGEMLAAYNTACFVQLEPTMPMPRIADRRPVGPAARLGRDRRPELERVIGAQPGDRLVAISLGGYDMAFPVDRWPRLPHTRFLVRRNWNVARDDIAYYDDLELSFPDLLRSIDAVIAKPGYGTIAEAGCNGCAMLWVSRDNWPEEDCLVQWLAAHGRARQIGWPELERGAIGDALDQLLAASRPPVPVPVGAAQAAELLDALLF